MPCFETAANGIQTEALSIERPGIMSLSYNVRYDQVDVLCFPERKKEQNRTATKIREVVRTCAERERGCHEQVECRGDAQQGKDQ